MSTKSSTSGALFPWRKRATYAVGSSQRKRQKQLSEQISMLYVILGVTVIAGVLIIAINWKNAGNAKSVSCDQYPEYCVPLVGGATDDAYSDFENTAARELDETSQGAAGVVRGMTADNVPFIGNPDAPIHFRTVSNYACSHCNTYHTDDLEPFIKDYVMTGQATLDFVINTTSSAPAYAEVAAQAAFCAGEQGAFWEMSDELYRLVRAYGASGFSMGQIGASADNMALDREELVQCTASGKYLPLISEYQVFQQDNGVSGTPTMFVRYEGETEWTRLEGAYRGYEYIAQMTEAANAAAQ